MSMKIWRPSFEQIILLGSHFCGDGNCKSAPNARASWQARASKVAGSEIPRHASRDDPIYLPITLRQVLETIPRFLTLEQHHQHLLSSYFLEEGSNWVHMSRAAGELLRVVLLFELERSDKKLPIKFCTMRSERCSHEPLADVLPKLPT